MKRALTFFDFALSDEIYLHVKVTLRNNLIINANIQKGLVTSVVA